MSHAEITSIGDRGNLLQSNVAPEPHWGGALEVASQANYAFFSTRIITAATSTTILLDDTTGIEKGFRLRFSVSTDLFEPFVLSVDSSTQITVSETMPHVPSVSVGVDIYRPVFNTSNTSGKQEVLATMAAPITIGSWTVWINSNIKSWVNTVIDLSLVGTFIDIETTSIQEIVFRITDETFSWWSWNVTIWFYASADWGVTFEAVNIFVWSSQMTNTVIPILNARFSTREYTTFRIQVDASSWSWYIWEVRAISRPIGYSVQDVSVPAGVAVTWGVISASQSGNWSFTFVSQDENTNNNLIASGVYSSPWIDCAWRPEISLMIKASHSSATNWVVIQQSNDQTNIDRTQSFTYTATTSDFAKTIPVLSRYTRIVYTNWATPTTSLRIRGIFRIIPTGDTWTQISTLSNVAGSITSTTILSAKPWRKDAYIFNDSTAILYLAFASTASTSSYTLQIAGWGFYELSKNKNWNVYDGIITGIWVSATGNARITEII
jgi:hypothetical protein